MTRILPAALAWFVLAATTIETSQNTALKLPPRLENCKEVAVFGAIWVSAPMRRYVEAVQDIESFERGGGFKVTRRLSEPPKLEDFAKLHLPEEDVADLRTCRVGACEVKLSEQSVQRFRTEIDWKAPDPGVAADGLMQQLALEYVTGYENAGRAPYMCTVVPASLKGPRA